MTDSSHDFKRTITRCVFCLIWLFAMLPTVSAQAGADQADSKQELVQLRSELKQTRNELANAQEQIAKLAAEIESIRSDIAQKAPAPTQGQSGQNETFPSAADLARQSNAGSQNPAASTGESTDPKVLAARVDELHQTKVESESKYRVKISGLILMNAFSNRGAVDVADMPTRALSSDVSGSVGASVRQSIFGLRVFGPKMAGADTSASISADFFGGYPQQQPYGTTLGILRLREASAHADWTNTSLVVGQENLFLAPLSPTSYATIAEPALSYSGNLWVWTPQVIVEHRFHTSDRTYFSVSGGLLAPLSEAIQTDSSFYTGFVGPGERARRPAYGGLVSVNSKLFGQRASFGIGGYGSHLKYAYGRHTDSWAVTSFFQLPLGAQFQLSGEAYRGLAVGGLGGGIWQSVVYNGDPARASTTFKPLNAFGGWTQLKFRPKPKWELNAAIGQDNVFASDLEWAPSLVGIYISPLARNRAAFGNVIFRPKSNLLLSVEYRKIWTYGYQGYGETADQVNVAAGVSF